MLSTSASLPDAQAFAKAVQQARGRVPKPLADILAAERLDTLITEAARQQARASYAGDLKRRIAPLLVHEFHQALADGRPDSAEGASRPGAPSAAARPGPHSPAADTPHRDRGCTAFVEPFHLRLLGVWHCCAKNRRFGRLRAGQKIRQPQVRGLVMAVMKQPAGWYEDPSGKGLRYWDGAWTDQRMPFPPGYTPERHPPTLRRACGHEPIRHA
jgi:Protein of unknown function (DUF2510)